MAAIDFVGLSGPEYEVDIERGKIREFARAMHAPLTEFTEGYHPVIPPTFLVSAPYTWGYTLERPRGTVFEQIDHDLSVSLHGGESFQFHGDLPKAGDRLIAKATLENVSVKQGANGGALTFLVMLTEYHSLSGQLRVEQRSTTVTTEQAPGEGDWHPVVPEYQPYYQSLDPQPYFEVIERINAEEIAVGKGPGCIETGALHIGDVARFQGVVGEDDPLHNDMCWANQHQYPSVFGLGTYQASVLAGYGCRYLDPNRVRSFEVRFKNIIWPGDLLQYNGVVTRHSESSKDTELTLDCSRVGGEVLMTASMVFDV